MPKPLLYKAPPRWQIWAFLGGALFIHGIAVVAAMKREPPPIDLKDYQDAVVVGLDAQQQPPEPTPPPEEPEAPPPPPPPTSEPEFREEQPTPPPRNKPTTKVVPIARPTAPGSMSLSSAKANALFAPRPDYPYEARSKKLTGSGVVAMTVDPASGNVIEAVMAVSTGSPILDNSALSAYRRWRFKPGTASKVKGPLTFTMAGAQY